MKKNYGFFNKRGVSMMEVLTAVIIISILSSTAYGGWRMYIRRSIMTEAKVSLSMIFAKQSQYNATCGHYHPDLKTIGAFPKGKLYYNVGGPRATLPSGGDGWGYCLTEAAINCSDCESYFFDTVSSTTDFCCNLESEFEDISRDDCHCYIKEDYRISSSKLKSEIYTPGPKQPCGSNKAVFKNKFCIIAATAINRDQDNYSQWDIWVVNHLNIIKHLHSP